MREFEADGAEGRGRRVRLNGSSAMALQGASLILAFVRIPVLLHDLGAERYGLWLTLYGITAVASSADFGMQYAVTQRVAELRGRDDEGHVTKVVATSFWAVTALDTIACALAVLVIGLLSPFANQANHAGVSIMTVKLVLIVGVAENCLVQAPKLLFSALEGFERIYTINIFYIVAGSVQLTGLVILAATDRGSLLVIASWLAATDLLGALVLCSWLLSRAAMNLSLSPTLCEWSTLTSLVSQAFAFLMTTLGGTLRLSMDSLVIILVLGATSVTRYSVSIRLVLSALAIASVAHLSLWPGMAAAASASDWAWIRRAVRLAEILIVSLTGLVGVALIAVGGKLILHWTGASGYAGEGTLAALAMWLMLAGWTQLTSQILISLGGARTVMVWGLIEGLANVTLSFLFAHLFGLVGVALGSVVSALFLGVVPLTRAIDIRSDRQVGMSIRAGLRLILGCMPFAVLAFLLRIGRIGTGLSNPTVDVITLFTVLGAIVVTACFGVGESDRSSLWRHLRLAVHLQ
jgi:O-antigen/teichoic acid export membrane protein